MNSHVNAIAGRLSLRPPQRHSLEILAESENVVYMVETKARGEMESPEVLAKKESAVRWCGQASDYARSYDGKHWEYLLIPHDAVSDNMTLAWFASQFAR